MVKKATIVRLALKLRIIVFKSKNENLQWKEANVEEIPLKRCIGDDLKHGSLPTFTTKSPNIWIGQED